MKRGGFGPLFAPVTMSMLDEITLGRFIPGHSPLHRLDPRLKLIGLPLFVVVTFASPGIARLGGLALAASVLVLTSGIDWRVWWRGLWVFRWLFLFTLLLHLLLSPGRTLFGLQWLSLDGLFLGMRVCGQLALAVIFSSMLTLTASPQSLAAAFAALLAPLERIRIPVQETAMLLLLVLHFIPILREESRGLLEEQGIQREGKGMSLLERGRSACRLIAPLVLRLADRADDLAHRVTMGEDLGGEEGLLGPLWPLGRLEAAALSAGIFCLAVLLGIL